MNFTKESHFLPLLSTADVVLVFLIVEVFHCFVFFCPNYVTHRLSSKIVPLMTESFFALKSTILLLFTLPTKLELFCSSKNSIICTKAAAI